MHWIAPPGKDSATDTLEKRLWASADQFRANSGLKAQEYSGPILGIIFLRFDCLLNLPGAADIGAKVNDAMRDIEKHNPQLAGVLPKTYNLFTSTLLKEPLRKVSEIPATGARSTATTTTRTTPPSASPSACRAPTTRITSGFNSSTPR